METINKTLNRLAVHGIQATRQNLNFSFGTPEQCRELFIEAFKAADSTIDQYQHLPEYDQVITWMTDTKGKGLLLAGSCGRGKSIILTGVLPIILMQRFNKIFIPYHANQIPGEINTIMKKWAIGLDEIGVEPQVNNYGERHEGFNTITDEVERHMKLLCISTNLNSKQILERYGERPLDRIYRHCKIIRFKGESLRHKYNQQNPKNEQ